MTRCNRPSTNNRAIALEPVREYMQLESYYSSACIYHPTGRITIRLHLSIRNVHVNQLAFIYCLRMCPKIIYFTRRNTIWHRKILRNHPKWLMVWSTHRKCRYICWNQVLRILFPSNCALLTIHVFSLQDIFGHILLHFRRNVLS